MFSINSYKRGITTGDLLVPKIVKKSDRINQKMTGNRRWMRKCIAQKYEPVTFFWRTNFYTDLYDMIKSKIHN